MIKGNVIHLAPGSMFTDTQREMLKAHFKDQQGYLTFGLSEEGEEYCAFIDDSGTTLAHFAKIGSGYVGDCIYNGLRRANTLTGVLVTSGSKEHPEIKTTGRTAV